MRMRSWHWWILSLSVVGLLGALYLPFQKSLQSATREKTESQVQTGAATSTQPTPDSAQTTPHSTPSNLSPEAQTIYAQVNPAVVTVYSVQELGSGVVVRSPGLVATNKHLVQNLATVKVKTSTGELYEGKVVDFDLQYDLALIQLQNLDRPLAPVTLADQTTLRVGDRVYAIGNPNGKPGVLSSGTFLQTTQHGSLQISAGMLAPGNSGGPLLNESGVMVGINKGLLADKTGLATAIQPLHTLLNRYETIRSDAGTQ